MAQLHGKGCEASRDRGDPMRSVRSCASFIGGNGAIDLRISLGRALSLDCRGLRRRSAAIFSDGAVKTLRTRELLNLAADSALPPVAVCARK